MYTVFEKLLKERGVTAYKVAKDTGITTSTLSSWKTGRYTPKPEKLKVLADYFGVSLEYLTTGKERDGEKYYINEETAEMAQKLFENRDLKVLFDAAQDATPEDLKTTYDMLMALKRKERGEND